MAEDTRTYADSTGTYADSTGTYADSTGTYANSTRTYWDTRHADHDELASGAHLGLDRTANEIFYARRLGTLLSLIGDLSSPAAPLFVLDAGCGKGYFARALARCGHRVDAFDTSPHAIEHARAEGGGPRCAVAALDEWRSPWPYDIVVCVDVLFHVPDDEEWRAALRNLASLVRVAGRLIVTDVATQVPTDHAPGHAPDEVAAEPLNRDALVVYRPIAAYRAELEPLGLRHILSSPYGFREDRVGFHVFTRTR
ncbi:class I SAM-dependent methyltransferase [Streptomyces sp. HD]|uniref:class I SAM-dependent methyltransferase n=1 Tax=Streptomyces sp. HD TaxID=3020892 RepID=UPI00232C4FEF|nr:class I SAM-dependent methyltransferase [Streptomyces sp. HD]MDC0771262.1 methyltransferase domain-containing protein [Streptomyces sp. HD]